MAARTKYCSTRKPKTKKRKTKKLKKPKKAKKQKKQKLPKGFPRSLPRSCAKYYMDMDETLSIPSAPPPPLFVPQQKKRTMKHRFIPKPTAPSLFVPPVPTFVPTLFVPQRPEPTKKEKKEYEIKSLAAHREIPTPSAPPLSLLPEAKLESKFLPTKSLRRGTCERKYKEYVQGKSLGSGEYGEVFELCHDQKCPYVIKVQNIYKDDIPGHSIQDFDQEFRIHRFAYQIEIAPRIYDAWFCKPDGIAVENPNIIAIGFIVMDRMDGDLSELPLKSMQQKNEIIETVRSQIDKLHKFGFEHRDIFAANVFFKKNKKGQIRIVLGDFGLARLSAKKRPKGQWDGADDYERIKELDEFLTRKVKQFEQKEEKKREQKSLVKAHREILSMPPLEPFVFQFQRPLSQTFRLSGKQEYVDVPPQRSLEYGETVIPTAFDRPIEPVKLESKYKEHDEKVLPAFLECPSKIEYKKKLPPIPFPWRPYLQYRVQPKNIQDIGSDIWYDVADDVDHLLTDERKCFVETKAQPEYHPTNFKFESRYIGGIQLHLYDKKPFEKLLNHIIKNDFLPFVEAISLVGAQHNANTTGSSKASSIVTNLRQFPMPATVFQNLHFIANTIAEESIRKKYSPATRNPWLIFDGINFHEYDRKTAMELALRVYAEWFVPIKINGLTVYSRTGLEKIFDTLKNAQSERREAWAALRKQL